ncbi:MAG: ribonuclease P protein component [Pyrinomonadaceae bacterium]
MPKENRIRKSEDFKRVYSAGVRIKGRFMTAFVLASEASFQRIGITASKKAIGNAVKRNRSKRLLREAFRLSAKELNGFENCYDWVLNARQEILDARMQAVKEEFQKIVLEVSEIEQKEGGFAKKKL